jgi:hypothetical protein
VTQVLPGLQHQVHLFAMTRAQRIMGICLHHSRWQLVAPLLATEVSGVSGPLDVNLMNDSPTYDGRRRFALAPPGARDLRGKAALVSLTEDDDEAAVVARLAAEGAAFALLVRPANTTAWTVWRPIGDRLAIPAAAVAWDDAQPVIERARRGGATVDLTITVSSPYLYDVVHVERGRVPNKILHKVTATNSMRVDTRYADLGGFPWAHEQRFGWRPWQEYAWNDHKRFVATPSTREEWVSAGDSLWRHVVSPVYEWNEMGPLGGGFSDSPRAYGAPGQRRETWSAAVVRAAVPAGVDGLRTTRDGDRLSLRVPEFVDDSDDHYMFGDPSEVSARLWRDGALLAELPDAFRDVDTVANDARYRLALSTRRDDPEWNRGIRTETVWEFRSARTQGPRALPLLQVDYQVPTDLTGHVPGRRHHVGIGLRHQDGLAAPRRTSVRVEVSFDQGATWRQVRVSGRDGRWVADVPAGKGSVSLRVRARDGAGNAVEQTVIRAYVLR